jgi:hypothetical protein
MDERGLTTDSSTASYNLFRRAGMRKDPGAQVTPALKSSQVTSTPQLLRAVVDRG